MWISDLYQCAKTARTLEKWSQLPAPLKREVARNNFKLRLSPTAGTETSLLGYRIKFPAAGILKELYREVFVEAIYFFRSGKDDPIIIDCGSSIGVSVLFFKKLYPKSKIIAFEPDPFTFEILTENVKRNGLTNVELHQCALSDSDDPITFYRPLDADASSLRMNSFQPRAANSHAITVQAKRLSHFIDESDVDLLKMDIEGAEHRVLREITDSGKIRKIKRIHLEYHHHLEIACDNLSSLLRSLEENDFGYQLRASGPPWPSEGVFQDMLIYFYRKNPAIKRTDLDT